LVAGQRSNSSKNIFYTVTKKGRPARAQFNIRLDPELYRRYRAYCDQNGLDPVLQIINYIQRLVQTQYNVQEKLWEVMRKDE
jgi:hypothetical protein